MLHGVRKCKYAAPEPVQIPTEVNGEKYNGVTCGLSW